MEDHIDAQTTAPDKGANRFEVPGIGEGPGPIIIAGPCAIEDEGQALTTARALHRMGVRLFRGQLFKPRTSPDSFQGLGASGVGILERVREETGMLIVSEVMDITSLEVLSPVSDIFQVGARNMDNYSLLKLLAASKRPVILKRGMSATAHELLMAARYLAGEGKTNILLCERGIRTFAGHTRFTLDLSVVPYLKDSTPYPVLVDPSHATGSAALVEPMTMAALAAGADGVMIEVHPDPPRALSDPLQALDLESFGRLMDRIRS